MPKNETNILKRNFKYVYIYMYINNLRNVAKF